jgi:hypothetical protein
MEISKELAKKFFRSLYKDADTVPDDHFELTTSRIIAKQGGKTLSGDAALQGLMLNYLLDPKNAPAAKPLSAVIAGIKQRAVSEFTKNFPNTTLDDLVKAANEAGYEVQVLS